MVGRRLTQHDRNQLELKLAYEMDPGRSKQRYTVETYVFIPRTLGLTRANWPKERFFEDTSTFVRLRTPRVTLDTLASKGRGDEWFQSSRDGLDAVGAGQRGAINRVVRNLKLLGTIYRRTIQDESGQLADRISAAARPDGRPVSRPRAEVLSADLDAFMRRLDRAETRLRDVGGRAEQAAIPARVRDIWRAVDEFVAIVAEEALTSLVSALDDVVERGSDQPLAALRERLAERAVGEYQYRRGRRYPSFIEPNSDNEAMPYRRHVLKRIVSSVLYLEVREAESGRMALNLVGMLAAAAAMLFAVLMTVWAQRHFKMGSLAFISIAVGSYMVKDRIKEWGKRVLGRRVARFLPDKLMEVRERGSGDVLGICREAVSVQYSRQIAPDIMALRYMGMTTSVGEDGRPETVVRYTKEVELSSAALKDRHGSMGPEGAAGLNDIVRFDLSRLRARMDSPWESHAIVDPKTRDLVEVECARVYHVNLVLRYVLGGGKNQRVDMERVRVVLDQRGIKRVEHVGGTTTPLLVAGTAEVANG